MKQKEDPSQEDSVKSCEQITQKSTSLITRGKEWLYPNLSQLVGFWRVYSLSKSVVASFTIIVTMLLVAIFAPWVAPYKINWDPLGGSDKAGFLPPFIYPPAYFSFLRFVQLTDHIT